jgi:hypothetical protein
MSAFVEAPVQPPDLSEQRFEQMRAHVLDEVARARRAHARLARVRSLIMGRRPRTLVAVAAALAVLSSVPAVAQERWWWMDLPPNATLKPVSQVVVVGRWKAEELLDPRAGPAQTAPVVTGDVRWVVEAFMSRHRGLNEDMLCLRLSPDPPRPANDLGAGGACGFPVHGLLPPGLEVEELHWVGYTAGIPGRVSEGTPTFMLGPAAPNVQTVELENDVDRRVIRVPTHPIPREVGVDARFWIAVMPVDQLVHTIVPRDENGEALERWRLPTAQ